jgi:hypothetical protein
MNPSPPAGEGRLSEAERGEGFKQNPATYSPHPTRAAARVAPSRKGRGFSA